MKKIIFTTILLLVNLAFSQDINIDIKKSEIVKAKKKGTILDFSESDGNGGLITISSVRTGLGGMYLKSYKIDHYDGNLKLIKSVILENDKRSYIQKIFVKDNILHLLKLKTDKKTKNIIVNVLSSSLDELSFTTKKLYTFDRSQFKKYFAFSFGLLFFDNGFDQFDKDSYGMITFSKNKKYFVISFDVKNKEEEVHLFLVYDDNLNRVYETTFKTNIKDKYFDFEDIDISDTDGTVFLLGKAFENGSKRLKKKGKTNYHYELYKLYKDKKQKINFKEEANFIGSLYLLHDDSDLSLVGFYSEKGDYRYKGVCRFNLLDDLTVKNKSFQPFSTQFFEDKYRRGTKVRKGKKELKNLSYRGVFLDEKGNIIVNAEEFFITTTYVSGANGMGGHSRTVYHFNDIISVKLDKDGKLVWARNINKAQTNIRNASYTSTVANNQVYFFLNTSDKIKKLSNSRIGFKQTSTKKSNLYAIKIAENGEFTYKKLIDDKDSKVWYNVQNGILSDDLKSVIFQGSRGKNKQIIKLNIN